MDLMSYLGGLGSSIADFWSVFRWWDVLDVLIVAFIVYQLLLLIRGTRTSQILVGLAFLFFVFWVANRFEVRTVRALLSNVFDNFLILLILVFHTEIRRALSQVGRKYFFSRGETQAESQMVEELVKSCAMFSQKRIGVLIVVEKQGNVLDFIEAGTELDSVVSREVLNSIFLPDSPLHDGAVLLRKGRIHMARCFLPLTLNPSTTKIVGTRHRAAMGLTEETDALCIIVSEENGNISLAEHGKITHGLEPSQLRKALLQEM